MPRRVETTLLRTTCCSCAMLAQKRYAVRLEETGGRDSTRTLDQPAPHEERGASGRSGSKRRGRVLQSDRKTRGQRFTAIFHVEEQLGSAATENAVVLIPRIAGAARIVWSARQDLVG